MKLLCLVLAARKGSPGVACALTGLLLAGSSLPALETSQGIGQYAHTVWSRDSGLPASVVALAQTLDGRLWIGTGSGLWSFDGVRFQRWKAPRDQPLASESINALAAAADGGLWIGTREGLSYWKDATVRNYQISKGLGGPRATAILADGAGTVWVATAGRDSGGLCRVEGNHLRCFTAADGLPGPNVYAMLEDRKQNLWAGGLGLCLWKSGMPHVYRSRNSREMVYAIAEDRQGQIWTSGIGLKRLVDGRLASYPLAENQPVEAGPLLADRDGALWIGTRGQGLIRLHQGRIDRFTRGEGLSHTIVNCLLEDREGSVWVGTNAGLDQFREFAVTAISKREGLPQTTVNSVYAAKDGGVWVGMAGGLQRLRPRPDGQGWTERHADGLRSESIQGVFEEQAGRLWVVTNDGLAYWDRGRFHPRHLLPSGPRIFFVTAAEDGGHSVWLSDPQNGLLQLRDTVITKRLPWSDFNGKRASALESGAGVDDLWLGFADGGVAYYRPGQPVRWYSTPGTGDGAAVMDLHRTPDGALWIASRESLSRLQAGHLSTLTSANGLPCDRIQAMLEDDSGAFWLNTGCGLVRIDGAELSKWSAHPAAHVRARVYDSSDGLGRGPAATGYFRRAARSKDGRLWFAAFEGLAVIDPQHRPENRLPPPVRIEALNAGNTPYPLHSDLRLPARTKELRIDFTTMTYVAAEKAHFRYRLDGFEDEWHEVTGVRQALYTNLPPNHYTFRVTACNSDGIWNPTGAALDFSIDRAYYQANWFRLLCASGIVLGLWSLHRFRLRRMRTKLNLRFEGQTAERNRIAGEMHDTLLQELSGFALQLNGLTKNAAVPTPVRDRLREMLKEVEHSMREAREFVWDLRAPVLEEVDLFQALRKAGEEITEGEQVQLHVTVSGNRRPAPPKLQRHLMRIVQEATRNAVRYSRANEIEMNIAYLDRDRVHVQMRDDGCGFDLEKASRELGHWGITIMRERAQQIGAELKISSRPGSGTEVDIVAPMTSAP